MKNVRFLFLCLLFLPLHNARAADFQLWTEATARHRLTSCWAVEAQFAARFREQATTAYLYYLEVNLLRELGKGWRFVPGYRQMVRQRHSNRWMNEALPHVALIKQITTCGYDIAIRSRFEYRSVRGFWFYRQRVTCDFPLRLTPVQFRPSAYGEIFLNTGVGFSQGRVFLGAQNDFFKVGYIYRQHRPRGRWLTEHSLFLGGYWDF